MPADMVETMANKEGFRVKVALVSGNEFEVGSTDHNYLISLLLKRKRELSSLSLSQAAKRLGASPRNAYARYEQGRSNPTIDKLNELLYAVCPDADFVIKESAATFKSIPSKGVTSRNGMGLANRRYHALSGLIRTFYAIQSIFISVRRHDELMRLPDIGIPAKLRRGAS